PDCTKPSDHVSVHGPVPVSAAWIGVDEPEQMVASPETSAVGVALTVVLAALVLLPAAGSLAAEVTGTAFVAIPDAAGASKEIAIAGAAPAARAGRVHVIVLVPEQLQPVPEADTRLAPAGMVSVTDTEVASDGPAFETFRV